MKKIRVKLYKNIYINLNFLILLTMLICIVSSETVLYLGRFNNIMIELLLGLISGSIIMFINMMLFMKKRIFSILYIGNLIKAFTKFLFTNINVLFKYSFVSLVEELFWRGYLQKRYLDSILGIFLVCLIFTLLHFISKSQIYILSITEFYTFFLLLSIIFAYTDSMYIVVAFHLIRNLIIDFSSKYTYQKEVIQLDTT